MLIYELWEELIFAFKNALPSPHSCKLKEFSSGVTAPVGSTAYQWPCDGSANIQYCGLVLISSWYRLHIHMQLLQLFFFLNRDSSCYEFTALCYRQIHRNGPQKWRTSVEDIFILCRYKARLPMMQSEETIWFQSLLFQSLSESKRWIEVILHDKRKHAC